MSSEQHGDTEEWVWDPGYEAVFDSDYLYFYHDRLAPEVSLKEAGLIRQLLNLERGNDVLDIACGHGRIALPLAAAGTRVVGLDASEFFLELGREDASAQNLDVEFVKGDMRDFKLRTHFDCAFSWFGSFGYFGDSENLAVLKRVRQHLRAGGRFLLDTLARDWLTAHFQTYIVVKRNDDFMIDRNEFDPETGRVRTTRTFLRDGRHRTVRFVVRIFAPSELRHMLLEAGFTSVALYGETGEEFDVDSRRALFVADR